MSDHATPCNGEIIPYFTSMSVHLWGSILEKFNLPETILMIIHTTVRCIYIPCFQTEVLETDTTCERGSEIMTSSLQHRMPVETHLLDFLDRIISLLKVEVVLKLNEGLRHEFCYKHVFYITRNLVLVSLW